MKYAGKTFTLYASQPVAIQGSDSLYTYQNTGTGTATLQGSNNGKDWVTITTVTSGASSISSHSYAFLRMTGSTEVSVSRGEGGTGISVGGTAVSSSNPLPVVSRNVSDWVGEHGGLSVIPLVTCPAVSAKYGAMQIWNPIGSGKIYQVAVVSVWSTGTNTFQLAKTNVRLANDTSVVVENTVSGVANTSVAKVYTESLVARSTTGIISPQVVVNATTTTGSSVRAFITPMIKPNNGLNIEIATANLAFNAHIVLFEYDDIQT